VWDSANITGCPTQALFWLVWGISIYRSTKLECQQKIKKTGTNLKSAFLKLRIPLKPKEGLVGHPPPLLEKMQREA
jgi:hypothetical protein